MASIEWRFIKKSINILLGRWLISIAAIYLRCDKCTICIQVFVNPQVTPANTMEAALVCHRKHTDVVVWMVSPEITVRLVYLSSFIFALYWWWTAYSILVNTKIRMQLNHLIWTPHLSMGHRGIVSISSNIVFICIVLIK